MNEKISNTIALHQMSINELNEIKHRIKTTATDDIRFRVETKHWYGYSEPFLAKSKDKLEISVYTMNLILDEVISKEKERINKLIDMEIERGKVKMIEKVNPMHPDKIADRIAGAIVDLAYQKEENPKIAVEVLIGHEHCIIITETNVKVSFEEVEDAVHRIAGKNVYVHILPNKQDEELAKNQEKKIRCGDNGIFKGMPLTEEQQQISYLAHQIYNKYNSDGKYILDMAKNKVIICQSNAQTEDLKNIYPTAVINPLGEWTGGINVDTGATNRKLGSDMGDAVTGGGLHGKDLSKADVSINIYAFLKAQKTNKPVELCCAIGDEFVDGKPYSEIVEIARKYINNIGGFEKFAEWGLF